MTDDLSLSLRKGLVAVARSRRPDTCLRIDAPRLGVTGIVRMIEYRDVRRLFASVDLHADVDPHGALSVGAFVPLPGGVDNVTLHPIAPRHLDEQAAVVGLPD